MDLAPRLLSEEVDVSNTKMHTDSREGLCDGMGNARIR
jgi:hypothetical protein